VSALQVEPEQKEEEDPGESMARSIASSLVVFGVAVLISKLLVPALTGWEMPDWLAFLIAGVVVGLLAWAFLDSRRDERPYEQLPDLAESGTFNMPEPDQPTER
jgi:Kef-type K+ transport system membrane component KefB